MTATDCPSPAAVTTGHYDATLQHIGLLSAKRAKLASIQAKAEEQIIHRLASDYLAEVTDIGTLWDVYRWLRDRAPSGFSARWNAHMPAEASTVRLHNTARLKLRHEPDADGIWRGAYPLDPAERYPRLGTNVVYVLFDDTNVPCYVGSTDDFRGRVRAHHHQGKQFVRWMAYPCRDREAAYDLEVRLLREHKPYLNRKVGR